MNEKRKSSHAWVGVGLIGALGSLLAVALTAASTVEAPSPGSHSHIHGLSSVSARPPLLDLARASERPVSASASSELAPGETVVHGPGGKALPDKAFRGPLPKIVQRYVSDFGAIEPTSGFDADGTAYYISGGDGKDLKPRVFRSSDEGVSWENVSPRLVPGAAPRVSGVDENPPITGDPYIHVDAGTSRIFSYNQSAYLFCDNWDISDDAGESWHSQETCNDEEGFGDHPTITTGAPRVTKTEGYPNIVYFCAASGTSFCRTSVDGGMTFGPRVEAMDKGEAPQTGHVATSPDGRVYLPKVGGDAAWVAISKDDGQSWNTVMVDNTVWTGPNKFNSPNPAWPENNHDAAVAADAAGNVYFFWLGDDSLPYLSVSRDEGSTWGRPIAVGAPGVTAAHFPEIVAGEDGKIAFLYVGTDVPGGFHAEDDAMKEATWSGYVGFTLNALSGQPIFATATTNPPSDPLRRGNCAHRCYVDPGIMGNGALEDGMYDFLDIDLNPVTGRIFVSLVDLCNDACGNADATSEDGGAYSRAAVGVQVSGPRVGKP